MTDLQLPVCYNLIPHVKSDKVFMKSVLELRNPYGWSLLWFPKHEVTMGVLLLPGWDASPLQDYPPSISSGFTENLLVPFILLGGEMHCKSCRVVPHIFTLSGSNKEDIKCLPSLIQIEFL